MNKSLLSAQKLCQTDKCEQLVGFDQRENCLGFDRRKKKDEVSLAPPAPLPSPAREFAISCRQAGSSSPRECMGLSITGHSAHFEESAKNGLNRR